MFLILSFNFILLESKNIEQYVVIVKLWFRYFQLYLRYLITVCCR